MNSRRAAAPTRSGVRDGAILSKKARRSAGLVTTAFRSIADTMPSASAGLVRVAAAATPVWSAVRYADQLRSTSSAVTPY